MTIGKGRGGRIEHALSYRFYLERLDNPGLLARAVVTEDGDLAVPAGGTRRGGYIQVGSRAAGRRLARQLSERPAEFPEARCVRGDGWLVEWGPELDWRGTASTTRTTWPQAGTSATARRPSRHTGAGHGG